MDNPKTEMTPEQRIKAFADVKTKADFVEAVVSVLESNYGSVPEHISPGLLQAMLTVSQVNTNKMRR